MSERPELADVSESILSALERSQQRLANAPEHSSARAQSYATDKPYPREAAAFHQVGQLEQICRNEAAAIECHIKLLRSATGVQSPRQIADAIAASVRASLLIAAEQGQTIEQFLALGGDRAIGNNAAAKVPMQEME